MRVKIPDGDNQSWLNWGTLVYGWINGGQRPRTVGELKDQLTKAQVNAQVEGANDRTVTILDYEDDPTTSLVIVIPNKEMLKEKYGPITSGPYPLPLFYDIAYGGAARANLSKAEAKNFALMRIGEYTINECC